MTRQCTCGGIIRQHELVGDREAWTCNACGRYGAIERGDAQVFDIERMKRALASPRFTIPNGLTHEERRQFILDCAAGKIAPATTESADTEGPLTTKGN
jgi:hypothetical protein